MTNFSFKALGSAALLALFSLSAVAQTRYCIGGDLDHLSAAERASCSAAREEVRTAATRLHAPEDWHFVVVCGEQGWKDYTAVAERGEAVLEDLGADTDLQGHVTYLREARLHAPEGHELQRVVAHEVASMQLKTHDEKTIQVRMAQWTNTPVEAGTVASLTTDRHANRPAQAGTGI